MPIFVVYQFGYERQNAAKTTNTTQVLTGGHVGPIINLVTFPNYANV